MIASIHKTVLLNETIEGLGLSRSQALGNSKSLASRKIVLDATFGGGGHSIEILKRYPNAKIIALDQDKSVLRNLKDPRISFYNLNFRDLDSINFLPKDFLKLRPRSQEGRGPTRFLKILWQKIIFPQLFLI